MTEAQQRQAVRKFIADWAGHGDEKQDTSRFWMGLLRNVFGIEEPEKFMEFELPVKLAHTSFIDGYIPQTRVLIEQKSKGISFKKGLKQSDGQLLTPYQQARRYAGYLPFNQTPRWIVVCNFEAFEIHDMNFPNGEPEVIPLADLEKEVHRLQFLVDTGNTTIQKEMEVSLQAGELVGVLYDAILKQYKDPSSPDTLKSLNALCVRLVFCLYAEDAGIFGGRNKFHDYLEQHRAEDRRALISLFQVLDQKPEERDPYLDEDLASFPYVNGGLFADENIEIPRLGEAVIDLILVQASAGFDWSVISPTIFGAVFESTLNPETRRSGGMHYTSIENIHKVIDPLFLNDLKRELAEIKEITVEKTRTAKLRDYQTKLASLTFLDPACGSGNFLTESYLSLRRLENEVLSLLFKDQIVMGMLNPIQVSIHQFYGIEINDFAATVAKTALWIAESQMMKETEDVVHMSLDFLPLKTYANITEGNALRLDWETVVLKTTLNYIMGNPPFVGYTYQTSEQKQDLNAVLPGVGKNIDYVAGWYFKASQFIVGTDIRVAFVSTNSITQGEQVAGVWKALFNQYHIHIDFACRTFRWDSEANIKAHVHCVIVGFSIAPSASRRYIYAGDREQEAGNINAYLLDAPDIFIERRSKPLCDVPAMCKGSQPTDGGNLILSREEKDDLLASEPQANIFIRPYMMGKDFINRRPRYCLWMVCADPSSISACPEVKKRIEQVREYRLASKKAATRKKAETPMLFDEVREYTVDYVAIPKVSSENRRYIPMDYLKKEVIPGDKLFVLQSATLYDFGVLMSNVHMAWMRAVCGRLKSDYSYSSTIVYNNFPWPTPTEEQKGKIERTAQAILDARALYPDSSLADLYDEVTMPQELRKAHQQNDKAVMQAYGFWGKYNSESACVAELMKMYQQLVEKAN